MAAAQSPDVIVVGGGVTGTSIAYRLAQDGRKVLLLERRGICSGASGRNGGMTGVGTSMHSLSAAGRAVYAITVTNLAILKSLPQEIGASFQLELPGSMDIITTEAQLAHLRDAVAGVGEAFDRGPGAKVRAEAAGGVGEAVDEREGPEVAALPGHGRAEHARPEGGVDPPRLVAVD
ncbi:MAG: FAD-dependent oxidoreductase, partial [Chloroflexota bacterium]